MQWTQKLESLLRGHQERFAGQHNEIIKMAMAYGCDIHEHVPTLIEYGSKVSSITEMGVRFGWSTRSFLFAEPRSLLSIDKFSWGSIEQAGGNPQPPGYYPEMYKNLYNGIVDFEFKIADTTKLDSISETDLLFIDTFHHKDCLEIELAKHGNQAKKYIILHDTATFGQKGQADASCLFIDHPTTDEVGTGLWFAINPFLQENPHWQIAEHFTNNNGLTILKRQ